VLALARSRRRVSVEPTGATSQLSIGGTGRLPFIGELQGRIHTLLYAPIDVSLGARGASSIGHGSGAERSSRRLCSAYGPRSSEQPGATVAFNYLHQMDD